ncbi:MAG: aspartate aminotransferase family protein [Clostridiaceae bacterium]
MEKEEKYLLQNYGRFPVVIEKGLGSKVYDLEGKEYIDMTSGIGVSSLGHSNKDIIYALETQMNKVIHTSNLFYNSSYINLGEKLVKMSKMNKVFFSNSGAEANEAAIKAARKYSSEKYGQGRYNIITLKQSFHGRTMATLSATGQDKYHKHFDPFTPGFIYAELNNIDEFKSLVDETVCAVMMEAVQGEGGIYPMEETYAKQVCDICNKKDILVIFDEVQCGNGRCGALFAYETLGVKPDIVTTAKGLGAGMPIGAALFNEKTENVLGKGDHGSTFGGNPMATASALVVLEKLSSEGFYEEVIAKGDYIRDKIISFNSPLVKEIRGKGLMLGIELNIEVKDIIKNAIDNGVLFLSAGPKVIRMLPPLVIEYEEIDQALDVLKSLLLN